MRDDTVAGAECADSMTQRREASMAQRREAMMTIMMMGTKIVRTMVMHKSAGFAVPPFCPFSVWGLHIKTK